MQNIQIMLNDGAIGPKAILLALSALTTGNLNSKLKQGSNPYKIQDVLPSTFEYIIPPLTEEQQREETQNRLKMFMMSAPGSEKFMKALNG